MLDRTAAWFCDEAHAHYPQGVIAVPMPTLTPGLMLPNQDKLLTGSTC